MIAWKRAVALGIASWAIPFLISFAIFPLKRANAALFETLMALIVLSAAGGLFAIYFRGRAVLISEGFVVGLLWMAINLALDYPMFNFGPMKMPITAYYSEIGLAYLAFPLFGFCAARMVRA